MSRNVVALFALALAARLAALLVVGHPEMLHGDLVPAFDEPTYHRLAKTLVTTGRYSMLPGEPPTAFRPPGAILPMAFLYLLFGPSLWVGIAYVMLCSLAIVAVVRGIAVLTTDDRRVWDTATLVAAVMPTLLWTSTGIWSDTPATLACLASLLLVLWAVRGTRGWATWAAIGLCGSMAYLIRGSAVLTWPILVASAWVLNERTTRVARTATVLAALVLPVLPWGIRNKLVMGEFLTGATVVGPALWGANNPVTAGLSLPAARTFEGFDLYEEARAGSYLGAWIPTAYVPGTETIPAGAGELEQHHRYLDLTRHFLLENPTAALRLAAYKAVRIVSGESTAPSISGHVGRVAGVKRLLTSGERIALLLLGMSGLWLLFRRGSPTAVWYAAFLVAGLGYVFIVYVNARFLLSVTTVLLVPAAAGLVEAWDALRSWAARRPRTA
jgi:hypothetical protein